MSRWIDADALKYYGNHIGDEYEDRFHDFQYVCRDQIDNAPSIDICFCKECIKHNTHRCHMAFDLIATEDDDFCSYGSSSEKPNNSTTEDCSDIEEWYTFRDEQEYNARHGKE